VILFFLVISITVSRFKGDIRIAHFNSLKSLLPLVVILPAVTACINLTIARGNFELELKTELELDLQPDHIILEPHALRNM